MAATTSTVDTIGFGFRVVAGTDSSSATKSRRASRKAFSSRSSSSVTSSSCSRSWTQRPVHVRAGGALGQSRIRPISANGRSS